MLIRWITPWASGELCTALLCSGYTACVAHGHESCSWFPGDACRMAQQGALWGSHTAGHGEVWADGRLEMEPRKERPRKMLLTENPDTVVVKESSPRTRVAEQIFLWQRVTQQICYMLWLLPSVLSRQEPPQAPACSAGLGMTPLHQITWDVVQ